MGNGTERYGRDTRRADARRSRGPYIGDYGTQINIGSVHLPLPRVSRRTSVVIAVVVLLLAAVVVSVAVRGQKGSAGETPVTQSNRDNEAYGWGPIRPIYTTKEPARTAVFNSFSDVGAVPYNDERDFVLCKINGEPQESLRNQVEIFNTVTNIAVGVWVNNSSTAPKQNIFGASIGLRLPSGAVTNPAINVHLKAANATEVWDGCRIQTNERVIIEYIPGTAYFQSLSPMQQVELRDEVIRGNALLPGVRGSDAGVIPSDAKAYGIVVFGVRVLKLDR